MANILNGKELSKTVAEEIKSYIENRTLKGLSIPRLAAVLVGDDEGSIFYVGYQEKLCKKLGIDYELHKLDKSSKTEDVIEKIKELNEDNSIHGIIILLPLPKHIDENKVIDNINPSKDVDGLTISNTGKFYMGEKCFIPCTPQSVMYLIKSTGICIRGKEAVIIGRSNIVGKPVASLLLKEDATVTICHSKTKELKDICKRADILVCCTGKPGFITSDFVKKDAIVIDVGTSSVDGKITGDVDFDSVEKVASFITPVPGGVGALTTNMLFLNTCKASEDNNTL